jgi:hypothetical protein
MVRELTADEVKFEVEALPEDAAVRGNAMASGDEKIDQEAEDEILERLDRGDIWAWCTVRVVAKWNGFEGDAFLGCCSYKDVNDFCQPGGYYEDMREEALEQLNEEIHDADDKIEPLRT